MSKLKRTKNHYEFKVEFGCIRLVDASPSGQIRIHGANRFLLLEDDAQVRELIEVLQRRVDTGCFVKEKFTAHEIADGKYGEYGVLESGSNWLKFGGAIQEFSTKEAAQKVADMLNAQE